MEADKLITGHKYLVKMQSGKLAECILISIEKYSRTTRYVCKSLDTMRLFHIKSTQKFKRELV